MGHWSALTFVLFILLFVLNNETLTNTNTRYDTYMLTLIFFLKKGLIERNYMCRYYVVSDTNTYRTSYKSFIRSVGVAEVLKDFTVVG